MKKFGIFAIALAACAMAFTSCEHPEGGPTNDLPSGFYVAEKGAELSLADAMDDGINEVDQQPREGMYEKYIVLEAGKEYQFINKFGEKTQNFGAALEYGDNLIITDNHEIAGYKASLVQGTTFTVNETALYHIVLDFDKDGKLADVGGAQCIVVPVEWGVRGGMNSWGWTAGTRTEKNGEITWTWKDQELAAGGEFKFAHNDCWKINLDIAMLVKANTNLGDECVPGAANVTVEKGGLYDITLTYKASDAKETSASYTMTVTLTQESTLPTSLYMIGNYCGWNWDESTEMVPVHSHTGSFWAVRYLKAGEGFKFCAKKEWSGDFCTLSGDNLGFEVDGNNCVVAADGLYRVEVDLKNGNVYVDPAEIYGIGDCFGGWEEGAYPFDQADGMAGIVVPNAGNLRMYVKLHDNPGNWWQSEFNVYDDKIVYRAAGGDQEAVAVEAGSAITLEFNAEAGSIE